MICVGFFGWFVFWITFHCIVFLMCNIFCFSFVEGTMETDLGTELPVMPACLHRLWGALSQGKVCTHSCIRV